MLRARPVVGRLLYRSRSGWHSRISSSSPSFHSLPSFFARKVPKGFGNFADDDEPRTSQQTRNNKEEEEQDEEEESSNRKKSSNNSSGNKKKRQEGKEDPKDGKPAPGWPSEYAIAALVGGLMLISVLYRVKPTGEETTYQDIVRLMEGKQIQIARMVVVNHKRVDVYLRGHLEPTYYFYLGTIEGFERLLDETQHALGVNSADFIPVKYSDQIEFATTFVHVLPEIVSLALFGYIFYRIYHSVAGSDSASGGGGPGGIFSIGKSKATLYKPDGNKVTFKDVAGLDEAKVEIMEFVKFLRNPDRFTRLGARIPKGALLVGPPGTGKTLLAKATAGEAGVPFYSISGSDFVEMFVGVGPSRVRDLFKEARQNSPCIIFIDEIDAVGRSRSKGGYGGNDERENTLNQMLVEMDGFNSQEGVVVLAGTNRADILDKALLRPGRFDRQIQIDKPTIQGRSQIFKVHLKKLQLGHEIDDLAHRLSALTPGMSGADIANVCNEAALIAARVNKSKVELVDFEAAVDRVLGGLERKSHVMGQEEKKIVAYHEAGHAVVGWFLEHADPLLKVTIVPRGAGALGFAQYLPKELSLYQTEQLTDMMCMALGGRAAEHHFFSQLSTGAADDLKKVTRIAYGQVAVYGMAGLGHVSYQQDESQEHFTKPYSEATAQKIDSEVSRLIGEAYSRTRSMIEQYKDKVEALAQKLLEVETINHDVIVAVLGPRPFVTDSYREYMTAQKDRDLKEREKEEQEKSASKKEQVKDQDEPSNKK